MWFAMLRCKGVVLSLKFQVEIEIYSRPKTTTRNYEFFVPFEMEENTYSKPAFLETHESDGNPPHGQEKGPSICSAVRMFGDYDLWIVDSNRTEELFMQKKWKI